MGRTLLLGDSRCGWHDWLASHSTQDLLCLDPADAAHGNPGRLKLVRSGRVVSWRFFGGLQPLHAPHLLLAAAAHLLQECSDEAVVQMSPVGAAPLARQVAHLVAELVRPDAILVAEGSEVDLDGWPVGPEIVPREDPLPETVVRAQRKAQWLKLLENCSAHRLDVARLSLQGTRLGSGRPVPRTELDALELSAIEHAEVCGKTLLLVGRADPEDRLLARALDRFHCERSWSVRAEFYKGLLCAFGRERGEEFGMGVIESIEFDKGIVHVRCTAVAPAPVRTLKIGLLRVDSDGNEGLESRPWQV